MASSGTVNDTLCTASWGFMKALPEKLWAKVTEVAKMAKKIGEDDPRRIIHGFKAGLALLLISILYYLRPSFQGFRDNAIWAIITVTVVMEFSVGATLGRGLNRMLATLSAGALGVATHCIASAAGEKGQPVLISFFIFLTAGTVTFMRFFPRLKARYDYGLLIFILTYCMVSASGYEESQLIDMAQERLTTIIIGSFTAIMVSICICPVWIGADLHNLVSANIQKLSDFLQGFGDEYFKNSENTEAGDDKPHLEGYKSVLSSKGNEETMANLARWEPCHGRFGFRHPWKQYLKVGTLTRQCAYKIEALSVHLHSKQIPHELRIKIQEPCNYISSESGIALKEISLALRKMIQPMTPNLHVENAKNASESLKAILRRNPWEGANVMEIIPAAAVASLLIEIVICTEEICEAVEELASLAKFKRLVMQPKEPSELLHRGTVRPISGNEGADHIVNVGE